MATLTIEVPDDYAREVGLETLAARFQREMEVERLHKLALKLDTAVKEAGLEHDQLFREARQQAWNEYKKNHLNHLFPLDEELRD